MRHVPIKKLKEVVMKCHANQEGKYIEEMTTWTNDCEFCKSSFQDVCCRCSFNWNSQTVQLFHADREVLQSQLAKLNFHAENPSPGERRSSSLGAVSLDNVGTYGLENASR
jgi:hypothetical protein